MLHEPFVETIQDWTGRDIPVVRSRGGVTATVSPFDNLMRCSIEPWPPPEIVQKLYASEHASDFDDSATTKFLSYYTSIQSINSEDAITWSFFGPLVYGEAVNMRLFLAELCPLVGISEPAEGPMHCWLWRTLPHPAKPASTSGPEIDFGFQVGELVVFGEAKWNSKVAQHQGPLRDKDQIELRGMFCSGMAQKMFPDCKKFLILGLSRDGKLVSHYHTESIGGNVLMCDITWADLCDFKSVPHVAEFKQYYHWKLEHGRKKVTV